MSAYVVSFGIEAAHADDTNSTKEVSVRRQIQSDKVPVAVTGVAEAFGEALSIVARLNDVAVDDVVYAFRKGLTGERA